MIESYAGWVPSFWRGSMCIFFFRGRPPECPQSEALTQSAIYVFLFASYLSGKGRADGLPNSPLMEPGQPSDGLVKKQKSWVEGSPFAVLWP